MTGEKRFRTALFGYKKKDVYDYIEKLAKNLEEQIKQNKVLSSQNEELQKRLQDIERDRTYIANAIIKAEEQAKSIINESVKEAEHQKEMLLAKIEDERMKYDLIKNEIRELRLNAIDVIKRYEQDLAGLISEEEHEMIVQEAAVAQEEINI